MKKIYIAGPMTGLPDLNFPAFHAAHGRLEQAGWLVFNPALHPVANDRALRIAFLWNVSRILESDAIYMLRNWEQSSGARAEHALAAVFHDCEIFYEGAG